MTQLLRKSIYWIKTHLWIFKLIFITSVMFFVVNQLTNILQGMTWHKFMTLIFSQGLTSIIMMLVVGLIAVYPMILYDVATTKTLGLRLPLKTLCLDGWVINTINNLVGFGGVVGVTLRMNKYGKEQKGAQTLATITKTALFMLTGLSILCFVMFLLLVLSPVSSMYRHYQWWLLAGSLFAPGVFIFIRLKKELFKEFTSQTIALFYLASLGQWSGALCIFMFIGHEVAPHLDLIKIAPLFIAATLIGMITMVPGGIGTFDVIMILGLSIVGINKEVAVMWLLFYRLFYYVVPFISGCLIFVHQTGVKLDVALNHFPSHLFRKMAYYFLTVILYLSGIVMIVLSTIPNLSVFSQFFNAIFPFSIQFVDAGLNMMIGLLLIGLARGVYQRVQRAYKLTIIVLALCLVNVILVSHSWQLILLFMVTLLCMYWSRHEFTRQGIVYSWGSLILDFIIFIGIAIFYGLVGYFINTHHQFASTNFILFPSESVWLRGLIGLVIAAMILIALYYYLSHGVHLGEVYDQKRYERMIQTYGDSRHHHLGFLGSYRYYYYRCNDEDKVCFLFKKIANHCVVLGNPLGDNRYFKVAIEHFKNDIARYNYQAIFYSIDHHCSVLLHDFGYEFMKVGEEGYHDKDDIKESVSCHTQWLTLEEKREHLEELVQLSRDFEALHRPLYFNRAYYTSNFVLNSEVMIYKEGDEIVGYATLSRPAHHQMALMYLHYSDQNIVKTFIRDIQSLCESKDCSLSLGVSPLSNVGTSHFAFKEEKMINVVYSFGDKASHLEKMNQAMAPYVSRWENRYMSYPRHQSFYGLLLQVLLLMIKKDYYKHK